MLQTISGAGHHVYADKPEVFNKYVVEACNYADGIETSQYPAIMPSSNSEKTESDSEIEETTESKSSVTTPET